MENTKEYVASTIVRAGQNSQTIDFVPMQGHIVGVIAFFTPLGYNPRTGLNVNNGFVRASIKDDSGEFVSKMQSIENYKRRDGGSYVTSAKPLNINGGSKMYIDILAKETFDADFYCEFIFIYKDTTTAYC